MLVGPKTGWPTGVLCSTLNWWNERREFADLWNQIVYGGG